MSHEKHKPKKQEPCMHEWGRMGVVSFHKKNFCLASQCHKCEKKKTLRKLEYKTLVGNTALIIDNEVKGIFDMLGKLKFVDRK